MDYPGNLFVVAAPSGAGKSSLVNSLLQMDSHLVVSISHTTRKPRGQEQDGREYIFIDEPEFRKKIVAGDFFEWAEVHGNLYGTSRGAIERLKRSPAALQSTPRSASLARINTNAMPCSTCTDASGKPSRRCSKLPAAPKPPNRIATGITAKGLWRAMNDTRIPA